MYYLKKILTMYPGTIFYLKYGGNYELASLFLNLRLQNLFFFFE